jgi:hypothetical protein
MRLHQVYYCTDSISILLLVDFAHYIGRSRIVLYSNLEAEKKSMHVLCCVCLSIHGGFALLVCTLTLMFIVILRLAWQLGMAAAHNIVKFVFLDINETEQHCWLGPKSLGLGSYSM